MAAPIVPRGAPGPSQFAVSTAMQKENPMLHVDDVDALYEEFVRRGALIKQAPADKPHGMREFSVTTPDGHRLMIGQDLASRAGS
ncbi:VOC family protein [Variovorax paradoxus]|uniref:VOC family protein n=1 Tax=Variovorax paradoxus TaxID=34073 RepID=UPI003ECC99A9